MVKRSVQYNYMKPPNYFNRLFTFFTFISLTITIVLLNFVGREFDLEIFLLHFVVMIFLFLCFAVVIEYFYLGEYMKPHERLDIMHFIARVLDDYSNQGDINHIVSKYNHRTFSFLKNTLFGKRDRFVVSNLRKVSNHYIVTLLDERLVFRYFFFKFFSKKAVITLDVKKIGHNFKIVRAR